MISPATVTQEAVYPARQSEKQLFIHLFLHFLFPKCKPSFWALVLPGSKTAEACRKAHIK